ncbi:FAD-linked oxidoreductase-like protein [Syncephalis fuscata]|nr:FAD-linked oxidoreductase-like protein [Syncephalis fuscata]
MSILLARSLALTGRRIGERAVRASDIRASPPSFPSTHRLLWTGQQHRRILHTANETVTQQLSHRSSNTRHSTRLSSTALYAAFGIEPLFSNRTDGRRSDANLALIHRTFDERSTMCAYPQLVSLASKVISLAERLPLLNLPVRFAFCGGETVEETLPLLIRMHSQNITATPTARREPDTYWQTNRQGQAAPAPGTFFAVKCTALASDPEVFERWSAALRNARLEFDELTGRPVEKSAAIDPPQLNEYTIDESDFIALAWPYLSTDTGSDTERQLKMLFQQLDSQKRGRLDWADYPASSADKIKQNEIYCLLEALDRLERLCDASIAKESGETSVRLMIDANKSGVDTPQIYDTYQLYLRHGLRHLIEDIVMAERNGYRWAGKLVRGAYVSTERRYAEEQGQPSAIWPSKPDTDRSYDAGAAVAIELASNDAAHVVVATHNNISVVKAVQLMEKLNTDGSSQSLKQRIHFAQLLGMGELISARITEQGYQSAKYVPYGPVQEVVPYLLRRAEENGAMFVSPSAAPIEDTETENFGDNGPGEDRSAVIHVLRERLGWRRWVGLRQV